MSINMKFIALGSAGVVALAGAGVYAGTLTPTTTGKTGAGAVVLQSSCTAAATVTPQAATWNETSKKFEYTKLTIAGTFTDCTGQKATANVYKLSDGSQLAKTASAHSITAGEVTAGSFEVTLDAGVDAGITAADYNYGLVIQTA